MDKDQAHKIAQLARINLSDSELEKISAEMGDILEYVGKIQSAPVDMGKEDVQINADAPRNIMIDDDGAHDSGVNTEKLLNSAPQIEKNQIKVKKIL